MTVVLLEPHPDDCALFACFLALKHQAKVITVLQPHRMSQPDYPQGLAHSVNERLAEHDRVMRILGLSYEMWEFSDLKPDWPEVTHRLHGISRPELVIAPLAEVGGNEQHNQVAGIATMFDGICPILRYPTYTSAGRSRVGTEVEAEPEWIEAKLVALTFYRSQIRHPATRPHFLESIREYVL